MLAARQTELPPRLAAMAPRMAAQDWLGSYRQRDSVDRALRGIATRLSRNGDRLVACLEILHRERSALEATFLTFFPELVASSLHSFDQR